MGKTIDEAIIQQIPVLYRKYGVKTKVAKELGIAVSTVSKYLSIYEASPESKKKIKITEEVITQINELYSKYRNQAQVAREIGISVSTVKRHLNEENLKLISQENEDRDALWFYIYRLFGQQSEDCPVSEWNIIQIQKFKKQGMPFRGQLLTLKYFYEVEKADIRKARGSVGIIPFAYSRAERYYKEQAKKADEITRQIQSQLEKDRIEIKYNPSDYFKKGKKKQTINLNELGE